MTDRFKEKFISFVDILGFKSLVEASERDNGFSIAELNELRAALKQKKTQDSIRKYGPTTCPESSFIDRTLDLQVSQISDCVVASVEISPVGIINLISHAWIVALELLTKGVMVRGYITKGSIFHPEGEFPMGTGYQSAIDKERNVSAFKHEADERGAPFIEIDSVVCEYIQSNGDACTKEMFSRMTRGDEFVTAIYPFQSLSHSFAISGFGPKFDPEKEKSSNNILRTWINNFKELILRHVDQSNVEAIKKSGHYIGALDKQLEICRHTDEVIDQLSEPFPAHSMKDLRGQ